MKELGLNVKTRPVEVGYEVRCITPKSFDTEYCSMLGMGVYELFTKTLVAVWYAGTVTGESSRFSCRTPRSHYRKDSAPSSEHEITRSPVLYTSHDGLHYKSRL